MRVLAFDCSSARGSVAVVENGETLFAETFDCPRGRGGEFFSALERAFQMGGRPNRVVVGIGPGSYNGLRSAISAAEGLRLAAGVELVGIASVRALPCDALEYVAISDARGGVFYWVRIREREVAGDFELVDAAALAARLGRETVPVFTASAVAAFPQVKIVVPDAVILAALGAEGKPADIGLEPLYLKPAHITQPKRTMLRPGGK